jgi:hypothetical protein
LGLTAGIDTGAPRVLSSSCRSVGELKVEIINRAPRAIFPHDGKLNIAPDSVRAFKLAVVEAESHGDLTIGTEHLLLGVIVCERGVGPKVLTSVGLNTEKIR